MTKSDKTAGALLIALFGYGLYTAGTFPDRSSYFPMFICGVGLLLSALLIVSAFMRERKGEKEEGEKLKPGQRKRLLLMGLMIIVYAAAIESIGFTVSTIVFMTAASCLLYPGKLSLENRKPFLFIAASSVVISVLIFVVFKNLLYVPLPSGVLF